MKTFKAKIKCPSCKGTGIYVGMAEKDGAGVVCNKCSGTGCFEYNYEYEPFTVRESREDVQRVFLKNPGIMIGVDKNLKLNNFGGISYFQWFKLDNPMNFPPRTEMRNYCCPKWWNQKNNISRCNEAANWGRDFSGCKFFNTKHLCWKEFDYITGDNDKQTNSRFIDL